MNNPEKYIGISADKVESVCGYWRKRLGIVSI
jgi:hypothetical protein